MNESAVLETPPPAHPRTLDHLSWSGIRLYQSCSRRFWYRYVAQIPEEYKASSLAFGSSIHRAIEHIHEARLQGLSILSIEELLSIYDSAWAQETQDSPVQFCKNEDPVSLRALAEKMLGVYSEYANLELTLPDPSQVVAVEHSHRFMLLPGVPAIEMRLDLLELRGEDLIVTDIKTSRSKWTELKIAESLPQIVLYAHGLLPTLKALGAKRLVPRFAVISKGKAPVLQILEPHASQDDSEKLKATVRQVWDAIQKQVFLPNVGWHCSLCPYKAQCLGR